MELKFQKNIDVKKNYHSNTSDSILKKKYPVQEFGTWVHLI